MGQAGPPDPRCTLLHCRWRGARPVCGCARCAGSACCAAARSTCWSATLRCASRWRRTGAPGRPRAAPGRCRRPMCGGVSRWSCSWPGSARTRLPSSSRPCSGRAHATGTMGAWRQRAVSCWGCLLYAAFCLSTARLVVQAQTAQTAQSEQRQDAGVAAELLRTGWGRTVLILAGVLAVAAGVETGRRSVRLDFRERFTAAHMPQALAILTRALGAVGCVARAVVFVLVGVFLLKAAVLSSAKQAKGLERGLPFGGQLRLRFLAAGRARVRPSVLRLVLPARSPLPRPHTRPLRRRCGFLLRLATPGHQILVVQAAGRPAYPPWAWVGRCSRDQFARRRPGQTVRYLISSSGDLHDDDGPWPRS